jgi:uncharacterized protein (TIGR01777 family)
VRVAVVGATGLIGRALCAALVARGDDVTAVSRRGAAGIPGADDVAWDPEQGPVPGEALAGAAAVVNVAGAPMDRRWTVARKRAIRESRVLCTRLIAEAMAGGGGPGVLVNASGTGYYGPRGDEELDETAAPGSDFLALTCVAWEREAARAAGAGVRVVMLRTGVVLAAEGGALPRLARPVRLFAGGPVGGGRQWLPWIHIDDEVGLIMHAIDRAQVAGPVNAVAPGAVRQREAVEVLARVLGRPSVLPVPAIAVRLAVGQMATLVLDGQRAVPRAALAAGYRFRYPELAPALRSLLS